MKRPALRSGSLALSIALIAAAAPAQPDPCPGPTAREISLPTQPPLSCLALKNDKATIVLNKGLVQVHASGATPTHADDARLSRWNARQAAALLKEAKTETAGAACTEVDATSPSADWLGYVALQIEEGRAIVYPAGSPTPAPTVVVRDSPMPCSKSLGGISTRAYRFPGGSWFLAMVTAVS